MYFSMPLHWLRVGTYLIIFVFPYRGSLGDEESVRSDDSFAGISPIVPRSAAQLRMRFLSRVGQQVGKEMRKNKFAAASVRVVQRFLYLHNQKLMWSVKDARENPFGLNKDLATL